MGVLPANKVPGDILTAAEFNQLLTSRDGFLHPIDPTTRDEDDNVQDLGSASNRWKDLHANGAVFGSKDDVIIGGQTLTQILEDNVIDTYGTEELLSNTQSGTTLISGSFIKAAGDLIVRVQVTAFADNPVSPTVTIAFTNGKVETRTYAGAFGSGPVRINSMSHFIDIFDISNVANGATVQVTVTSTVSVTSTTKVFRNAF